MSLFNAYRLRGKLLQTSNLFAVSNARALLKNNPSIAASAISTAAATTLRGLVNNNSSSSNYNIRSNRNVTNNNVLTTRTRSYYSSPSIHTSNLERIEELAEQFPQDASKQEALYKALNEQGRYYEVIQRYDRKEFATNMRCRLQYVKALSKLAALPPQIANATTSTAMKASIPSLSWPTQQQPPQQQPQTATTASQYAQHQQPPTPQYSQPQQQQQQQQQQQYYHHNSFYQYAAQPPQPQPQPTYQATAAAATPPSYFPPYMTYIPPSTTTTTSAYYTTPTATPTHGAAGVGGTTAPATPDNTNVLSAYFPQLLGQQGNNVNNPIYVTYDENKNAWILKLCFGVAGTLIFFALVATFLQQFLSNSKGGDLGALFGITSKPVEPVKDSNKKFNDVKGCTEAKEELVEIVEFLKNPEKFTKFGGKLPRGVLLVGPPGTGKTLLAKAVAGEAGVPFFYTTASEFDEMFVGVGAKRIRELFAAAREHKPCIIFIDEIDAMGQQRDNRDRGADRMTLNQFLAELDGFNPSDGIIVIGATNFPDGLDNALTRAGRFDKHVHVDLPDVFGRKEILDYYLSKTRVSPDLDPMIIARGIPGFSGADIESLVNIASLRASMADKEFITEADLDYAKDRILMGAEKKSKKIDEKNLRITAYHEGGHALVSLLTPGADPIHKATIMPRGTTLGMVVQLPEEDHENYTYRELKAKLVVMMGGRAAEEMIFGTEAVTTGAYSDIRGATDLAKKMVKKFGMSARVGPMNLEPNLLGDDGPSLEMERLIDEQVTLFLNEAYDNARKLLRDNEKQLHAIADALLRYETLSGKELQDLVLHGKQLDKEEVLAKRIQQQKERDEQVQRQLKQLEQQHKHRQQQQQQHAPAVHKPSSSSSNNNNKK